VAASYLHYTHVYIYSFVIVIRCETTVTEALLFLLLLLFEYTSIILVGRRDGDFLRDVRVSYILNYSVCRATGDIINRLVV